MATINATSGLTDPAAAEMRDDQQRDTSLEFVLSHRIAFTEFFGPRMVGDEWLTRPCQYEPALSGDILIEGGRGMGKSLDMQFEIIFQALNDEKGLHAIITAFRKAHVKDRMDGVISMIGHDRLISRFMRKVDGREPINRQPRYEIHFYRRGTVYGCAVGEDKNAVTIQGLHPARRYMEESHYFPDYAWNKFQGTAAEKGTIDRFYGIRDGRRGTPWWGWDTNKEEFIQWKGSRFAYTRRWQPHYDTVLYKKDLAAYGGEDTPEFKNEVDGEWGEPTFGEWNMDHVNACRVQNDSLQEITIKARQIAAGMDPQEFLPITVRRKEQCESVRLAMDCQYAEPSCVLAWEKLTRGKHTKWTLTTCLWLAGKMDHDEQAKAVIGLAKAFDGVEVTALDTTGGDGRGIAMALARFASPYCGQLVNVDWKNKIIRDFDEDDDEKEAIKISVKDNAIRVLRNVFATRSVWLPKSERIVNELMSETRKRTESGIWTLRTPANIHIPEAMRVFAHILYLKDEAPTEDLMPICQITGAGVSTGAFGKAKKPVGPAAPEPGMSGMIVIR